MKLYAAITSPPFDKILASRYFFVLQFFNGYTQQWACARYRWWLVEMAVMLFTVL
jgi:exonuclease I